MGLANLTASGTIATDITTTDTLTTSGPDITVKSDVILFGGLDRSIYMDAHPSGVLFYSGFYLTALQPSQNGVSLGT